MPRQLDFQGFVSSQDPRTYPRNAIRNLQVQGGDQNAILSTSQDQTQGIGQVVPDAQQILNALKQYQKDQQLKQAQSFGNQLPQRLQGLQLTGSQIQGFKQGEQQTFEPTIGGIRSAIDEFQQTINERRKQELQEQENLAKGLDRVASESGSTGLRGLLKTDPKAFKASGIADPESYIKGVEAREAEEKRRFGVTHAPSVSSGGGGVSANISPTAQAVLDGVIRLEDLTPTVRGQIAPQLAAAGFKSGPKLSSGQQDDLANMDTVAQQIQQILNYNSDGKLEGIGFGSGPLGALTTKIFGTGSAEAKNVRSLIGQIKGTIAKLRGGTSFTPNEEKLLNSYTPDINENSASAVAKLNLLLQFIANKKANTLDFAQERGVPTTVQAGQTSSGLRFRILP